MFLFFGYQALGGLCSLTRDWTRTPCIRKQSLNHWIIREVPDWWLTGWYHPLLPIPAPLTAIIVKHIPLLSKMKVTQSCLTVCDPMDYIDLKILQARILKWVTFPFSRGSSQPRDQIQASCIAGRFFTNWAFREALALCIYNFSACKYD